MTRQELIEKIIDRRINEIHQGGGADAYLRELFYHGNSYEGYESMTDEDLLNIWNDECDSDDELVEALEGEAA